MYRRLKNILGVSLMILAIVISQVPMPEAQAEIVREMTDEDLQVDDTSAHVVTFSMNGGTFRGIYNGYSFQEKTPVLVIDDGKSIDSFPDDKLDDTIAATGERVFTKTPGKGLYIAFKYNILEMEVEAENGTV